MAWHTRFAEVPALSPYDAKWAAQLRQRLPEHIKHIESSGIIPTVKNTVCVFNAQRPLPFALVLSAFLQSLRRPVKFPQVCMSVTTGRSTTTSSSGTAIIYPSGSFVMCGAGDKRSTVMAIQAIRLDLATLGCETGLDGLALVNFVVSSTLQFGVDLPALAEHNPRVSYDPNEFPGAMMTIQDPRDAYLYDTSRQNEPQWNRDVRVLVFSAGNLVLTGGRDFPQILRIVASLHDVLSKFRVDLSKTTAASRGQAVVRRPAMRRFTPTHVRGAAKGAQPGQRKRGVQFDISSTGPVRPNQEMQPKNPEQIHEYTQLRPSAKRRRSAARLTQTVEEIADTFDE